MEEQFTFFYRSHSPFSQWYMGHFEVENKQFNCAEQYMMYGKATLFEDEEIAQKILKAQHPREQKKLGRKVRNFDSIIWNANCKEIVYQGNFAKFSQDETLKKALFATQGTTLVEASPSDKIWGGRRRCKSLQSQNLVGHQLVGRGFDQSKRRLMDIRKKRKNIN